MKEAPKVTQLEQDSVVHDDNSWGEVPLCAAKANFSLFNLTYYVI